MVSQLRGLTYAFICVLLYAVFSIFFKVVSNLELHSMLFITIAMFFASFALLLKGGHNRLIFEAMKSLSTWIYSITFVLIFIFSIELLKYISATEMILVSRLNIILSLIFALIFLKRNTLEKGVYGLPFIILGLIIVFTQVENSPYYVLLLGFASALSKCGYFFSIELNKTGYKSKNYLDDFGILGFILGVSAFVSLIFMISGSIASSYFNIETRIFPTYQDYANPTLFILASAYGLIGFTALRYLEFKSIKTIGNEVFVSILTFVPIVTLCLEGLFNKYIIKQEFYISPELLASVLLIVTGGVLLVIPKIISDFIENNDDKTQTIKIARATEVFAKNDIKKTADILEISEQRATEIIKGNDIDILKSEFKHIQNCFNKKVAMSDHLTGLCNRLEFITELKHIDLKETASLFFIDLNKFKPVNDTHGHDAGDFILKTVARRLENIFADSTLTRLGGDEFALLVRNVSVEESIDMVVQANAEIAKPYHYKGIEINISSSTGFANYPADTDSPVKLLEIADEQMYLMKKDSDR